MMCIILVCAPILRPLRTFYRLPILTIVHFAVLLPFSCAPSASSANLRAIVGLYRPQSALVVIVRPCSTITSHLISRTTSNHSPLRSTVVDQPSSSLPWPAIRSFVDLSVHRPCDLSSIQAFEPLSLRPFPLYYTVWFDLALVHFVPFASCQSARFVNRVIMLRSFDLVRAPSACSALSAPSLSHHAISLVFGSDWLLVA